MKRYLVTPLMLMLFMSCGNDKVKKPSNLIPETKMVNIIVDLALLNSGSGIDRSILEDEGIEPEDHVYKKYSIDSAQFAASNNYYAHNIDLYRGIYARVKSKLNSKKDEYKKLSEKETMERKKKDSIRAAEKRRNKPAIIKGEISQKPTEVKPPSKIVDSLAQ